MTSAKGPLAGVKILEFAGLGPAPFAGMMLSDLGADILRIERSGTPDPGPHRLDARGRQTLELDLKQPEDVQICLRLCEKAEVLFEGNRPGVMERLGLGPDVILACNPGIVYGRMTGWGQTGPKAGIAGHDINYLSLSGALHAIGTADKPVPPLNLAADYGGGAMFLVTGILAALLHSRATGEGQIVDAAMLDGASYLMSMFYAKLAIGEWSDKRGTNLLDGGAPFYNTYQCADSKWISIGPLEPQFFTLLVKLIGITPVTEQMDQSAWPDLAKSLREVFVTKTQDEWCDLLEESDACFAPVLSLADAPTHTHNYAREAFVESGGIVQPAPAPRFSRTPASIQWPPKSINRDVAVAMAAWGVAK